MRIQMLFAALLLGIVSSAQIPAPPNSVKGKEKGGGTQVLFDEKWFVADVFISRIAEFMEFSPEMNDYLTWIFQKLKLQGIDTNDFYKELFGKHVAYIFVDEFPCSDLTVIPGLESQDYACTIDNVTYILKEKFKRFNFQGQALAIVHERLHNYLKSSDAKGEELLIMSFVDMMNTFSNLQVEQAKNQRRMLTRKENDDIRLLPTRAIQVGFPYSPPVTADSIKIWPYGGGRIIYNKANGLPNISANTYIDLNSRFETSDSSHVADNSVLLNSTAVDANIKNSTVTESELVGGAEKKVSSTENSRVTNTKIYISTILESEAVSSTISQSKVTKSQLNYVRVQTSALTNINADSSGISNASVSNSRLQLSSLVDAQVDNSTFVESSSNLGAMADVTFESCEVSALVKESFAIGFSCTKSRIRSGFTRLGKGAQANNVVVNISNKAKGADVSDLKDNNDNDLIITPNTQVKNLKIQGYPNWRGGTLRFDSSVSELDFGDKDCELKYPEDTMNIVNAKKLNKYCK